MATVASSEIGVLEENTLSIAQQPLIDAQAATAGPCIQYEDAAEEVENIFQVIFVVNSKAQAESLPDSGYARAIEQQALQGGKDHITVPPQGEVADQSDCREEESQLQAGTGHKDETTNILQWFHSTFSEIERSGIITLKDFKENARHSDVRILVGGIYHVAHCMNFQYHLALILTDACRNLQGTFSVSLMLTVMALSVYKNSWEE